MTMTTLLTKTAEKGVKFLQIYSCYEGAISDSVDSVLLLNPDLVVTTFGEEYPIFIKDIDKDSIYQFGCARFAPKLDKAMYAKIYRGEYPKLIICQ